MRPERKRPLRTWFVNIVKGATSWVMLPLIVKNCCWAVVLLGLGYFACRIIQMLTKR